MVDIAVLLTLVSRKIQQVAVTHAMRSTEWPLLIRASQYTRNFTELWQRSATVVQNGC